ncbi:TPA: TetR/AcrR family transcriptional regulator [Acinetobacter baumannii]
MRPSKLTRAEMLNSCALEFKKHGYHGTSMQMLASACGLTKGAFYYHYSNKENLLKDILIETNEYLHKNLFSIPEIQTLTVMEKFEKMHQIATHFFCTTEKGCLMGIISIEALYSLPNILPIIQRFFSDWQRSLTTLYSFKYPENEATVFAKQSVAEYEGAILMYRVTNDETYIDLLKSRIQAQLQF